jgi:hypothetical protein
MGTSSDSCGEPLFQLGITGMPSQVGRLDSDSFRPSLLNVRCENLRNEVYFREPFGDNVQTRQREGVPPIRFFSHNSPIAYSFSQVERDCELCRSK